MISVKERKKRQSLEVSEEEYYFRNLNFLLSNNGKILFSMYDIVLDLGGPIFMLYIKNQNNYYVSHR